VAHEGGAADDGGAVLTAVTHLIEEHWGSRWITVKDFTPCCQRRVFLNPLGDSALKTCKECDALWKVEYDLSGGGHSDHTGDLLRCGSATWTKQKPTSN
jgi:hypothetical protein